MLVATIAATATYKWLSSEGRSSAARLHQSEARQAALAGIESAKSWMTFHGNETGAIVKQFFQGQQKPISLDNVLVPLDGSDRTFSVSVVNVDISGSTYKIKVVSTVQTTDGSKHDEVAIFNVTGLYRVARPPQPTDPNHLDYEYSYFGATTNYSGGHKSTSMLINGNWSGNPNVVEKNLVVTGNMNLSGSQISVGGITCIGGDLGAQNYFQTKDLYVAGNAVQQNNVLMTGTCNSEPCYQNFSAFNGTVTGNAYFAGNVEGGQTSDFLVGGNMTLMGHMNPNLASKTVSIDGNLCLGDTAKVFINSTNHNFEVGSNLWIDAANHNSFVTDGDNEASYDKIILGRKSGSALLIANAYASTDYATLRGNKTFVQNNSSMKNCDPDAFITIDDDGHKGCYDPGTDHNTANMWKAWDGANYSPYVEVASASDKNYFYYVPTGTQEVEFKTYDDNNLYHGDGSWINPTMIGTYFVGGELFHDVAGVEPDHYYNYVASTNKATGSPYCIHESGNLYQPKCHVRPWFKSNGIIERNVPAVAPFECGSSVKSSCDAIWKKTDDGCDGSKYKVPDVITTSYDKFKEYANKACAAEITSLEENTVSKLNECYAKLSSDAALAANLYNGYLVVSLTHSQKTDPVGTLNGKFIFIYEDAVGQQAFPPTANDGMVLLYLAKGTTGEILQKGSGRYNYFIYTKGDIAQVQGSEWRGSMYATAEGCAKIKNINSSVSLVYDKAVVDDMATNGIICSTTATDCGAVVTPSPSAGGTSVDVWGGSGYDTDHIAAGAQLTILLESEYKNVEAYNFTAEPLNPSIVVLPRIIYLYQDAVGQLSDYYTIAALNGANISGTKSVSCAAGAPSTSGQMYNKPNLLTEGNYGCTLTVNGMSSSFYIVVKGLIATTPLVHFNGKQSEDLNSTHENTIPVSLIVPGVSVSVPTQFSVDIRVKTMESDKWHFNVLTTAGLEQRDGSVGDDLLYTYTGQLSSSDQTIPLFTVVTDKDAPAGNMTFTLQTPVECVLGSPSAKSINITGSAPIHRKGIDKYCEAYSCEGTPYASAQYIPDCSFNTGTWVEASGTGCVTDNVNEDWTCNAGKLDPITLAKKTVSQYCEVYIPTSNNSVVDAADVSERPDGYTLYASLKAKPYTLHVDVKGTNSGSVIVKSSSDLKGTYTQIGEACTNYAAGCDYNIYAGQYIEIVAHNGENDWFSYWRRICSTCSPANYTSPTMNFRVDNNYTYEAHFNEKDDGCFYTEFTGGYDIFCKKGGVRDCIDKCKGNTSCSVGSGTYGGDPDWLVPMPNDKGGYKEFGGDGDADDHFVAVDYDKNTANGSGRQTIVLNQAKAGPNGTMTGQVKVVWSDGNHGSSNHLNNGFIFRSTADGGEYLGVSIFAFDGKNKSETGVLKAAICYGDRQGIVNDNRCTTNKNFKDAAGNNLVLTGQTTILNVTIVANGDAISINVVYEEKSVRHSGSITFNLPEANRNGSRSIPSLNDDAHSYVGFKLSNSDFKVGDLGWQGEDYKEGGCFDYPTITCNMAALQMGGLVPVNTDVLPWVGFSSWFEETEARQACKNLSQAKYYYNGCDMTPSHYDSWKLNGNTSLCAQSYSDGEFSNLYGDAGLKLKDDAAYNFEYEGGHGMEKDGGIVRNAGVVVECEGMIYSASCGYFMVGSLTECSANEDLVSESFELTGAEGEVVIKALRDDGAVVNLRASTLHFSVEGLDEGELVYVTLIDDQDGSENLSQERSISSMVLELDVNDMSFSDGFNPEKVKEIKFTSNGAVTIKSVTSSCPNAVGVSNCAVTYSGSQWKITANVSSGNAMSCEIFPSTTDIKAPAEPFTCSGGVFTLDDKTFYDRLNDPSLNSKDVLQYTFTVQAYDDEAKTHVAAACEATTAEYHKAQATKCEIDKTEVAQGAGVPELTFSIENCPEGGCAYEVTLSDGKTVRPNYPAKVPKSGLVNEVWLPGTNLGTYLAEGEYYYSVRVVSDNEEKKTYHECKSTYFTVTTAEAVSGSCSISNEGVLSYNLEGAGDITGILAYSTAFGNLLGSQTLNASGSGSGTIDLNKKLPVAGEYPIVLQVGGENVPCGVYKREYSDDSELNVTCPSTDMSVSYTGTTAPTVTIKPTVSGCAAGCSYQVEGASATGTIYDGAASVTFDGVAENTTKEYSLKITDALGTSATCPIAVKFERESGLKVECPDPKSGVEQESSVEFAPKEVAGCNNADCSYKITLDGTPVASGETYSGDKISFTGAASSGEKEYTFSVTDASKKVTESCSFKVTYADRPSLALSNCPAESQTVNYTSGGADPTIAIAPKVESGCDNVCSYVLTNVTDKSTITSGSTGNATTSLSITGVKSNTTKNYKFEVADKYDGKKSCEFAVTYSAQSDLSVTNCPAASQKVTWKNGKGNANPSVVINPNVSGCGLGCAYEITGTTLKGEIENGQRSFTITEEKITETKNYVFMVTDGTNTTRSCSFSVTYESK